MIRPMYAAIGLAALLLVGGCASIPTGPSVMALPGSSKTFDQFRYDDGNCQRYAFQQIGGTTAEQSANDAAVRSAAVGTLIGAAAGAAIDGSSGAGVGAGAGLLFGSLMGADAGQRSAYGSQKRFDNAYVQCMYSRGHKVPVSASMAQMMQQQAPTSSVYSPPATSDGKGIPPPPAGTPPPPPPGY